MKAVFKAVCVDMLKKLLQKGVATGFACRISMMSSTNAFASLHGHGLEDKQSAGEGDGDWINLAAILSDASDVLSSFRTICTS